MCKVPLYASRDGARNLVDKEKREGEEHEEREHQVERQPLPGYEHTRLI